MTKTIRIENADNTNYRVRVTVQERKYDHEQQKLTDDWLDVKAVNLDYPTSMFTDYLTNTRRFLVEENGVQ